MTYLKFIAFGLPRSGKSSTFQRLIGEIINLQQSGGVSRSTGVAECRDIIIKPFKSVPAAIVGSKEAASKWESLKSKPTGDNENTAHGDSEIDHKYLAHLYFHLISMITSEDGTSSSRNESRLQHKNEVQDTNLLQTPLPLAPVPIQLYSPDGQSSESILDYIQGVQDTSSITLPKSTVSKMPTASELSEVEAAMKELSSILQSGSPKEFQVLLEKLIMINMMDVGGQPGFVDMLPAFTTGSALYFLFFRMDQEIHKLYPVRFLAADSKEEIILESSYCIEDVLCQLISSISCFESFSGSTQSPNELKSRALLFGTFKDQINEPDMLESCCKEIDETLWKTLSSMQQDLLLPAAKKHKFFMVDNMNGNDDIDSIRLMIEEIIRRSFLQTEVPPSWLMFRTLLILVGKPVVSLSLCRALANRLQMPTPVEDAIQFFHHRIGSLMYYPEVESTKDLVICDPQVIFDSITELVINTFDIENRAIPRSVQIEFESKGFFTLEHIECMTHKERKSHLTPRQLIDLLKHLDILAEVQKNSSSPGGSSKFIIPAVLKNASEKELVPDSSYNQIYSIMVYFDCGFVPYGVFCFVTANLISGQGKLTLEWKLRKDHPIKKNKVIFLVDGRFDVVLISRPQHLEIQVGQCSQARKKEKTIEDICCIIREQIVLTLNCVISKMKYKLSICMAESESQSFSMAFLCFKRGHSDHLMKVIEENGQKCYAQCLKDESEIDLPDQLQLVWYGRQKANTGASKGPSGQLTMDDLTQVFRVVLDARTKWYDIGLELKINAASLDAIEMENPRDVQGCLRALLKKWLRRAEPKPTWEAMREALKSPLVDEEHLISNFPYH